MHRLTKVDWLCRQHHLDFTIKQLESWLVLLDRVSRLSAIYTNPARIVRCYRAVSVGERKAMSGSTGHSRLALITIDGASTMKSLVSRVMHYWPSWSLPIVRMSLPTKKCGHRQISGANLSYVGRRFQIRRDQRPPTLAQDCARCAP